MSATLLKQFVLAASLSALMSAPAMSADQNRLTGRAPERQSQQADADWNAPDWIRVKPEEAAAEPNSRLEFTRVPAGPTESQGVAGRPGDPSAAEEWQPRRHK